MTLRFSELPLGWTKDALVAMNHGWAKPPGEGKPRCAGAKVTHGPRKFHYFFSGRSLCGAWVYEDNAFIFQINQMEGAESPEAILDWRSKDIDDCKNCTERLLWLQDHSSDILKGSPKE